MIGIQNERRRCQLTSWFGWMSFVTKWTTTLRQIVVVVVSFVSSYCSRVLLALVGEHYKYTNVYAYGFRLEPIVELTENIGTEVHVFAIQLSPPKSFVHLFFFVCCRLQRTSKKAQSQPLKRVLKSLQVVDQWQTRRYFCSVCYGCYKNQVQKTQQRVSMMSH